MKKATNKLFELKFHLQKDIYLLPALGYYPQHSQKVFRCSVNPQVITQPNTVAGEATYVGLLGALKLAMFTIC